MVPERLNRPIWWLGSLLFERMSGFIANFWWAFLSPASLISIIRMLLSSSNFEFSTSHWPFNVQCSIINTDTYWCLVKVHLHLASLNYFIAVTNLLTIILISIWANERFIIYNLRGIWDQTTMMMICSMLRRFQIKNRGEMLILFTVGWCDSVSKTFIFGIGFVNRSRWKMRFKLSPFNNEKKYREDNIGVLATEKHSIDIMTLV